MAFLYMVNYKERVEAEYDAIERTLARLPKQPLSQLSDLELAGVATLLQIFITVLKIY